MRKKEKKTNQKPKDEYVYTETEKDLRMIIIVSGIIFGILVIGSIIGSLVKTGELERMITDSKAIYEEMQR